MLNTVADAAQTNYTLTILFGWFLFSMLYGYLWYLLSIKPRSDIWWSELFWSKDSWLDDLEHVEQLKQLEQRRIEHVQSYFRESDSKPGYTSVLK